MDSLSDLVQDSMLKTSFYKGGITKHVLETSDLNSRQRCKTEEQRWRAVEKLGEGTYGTVWKEQLVSGNSSVSERAVKIIKLKKGSQTVDYNRELEAIAKFSHQKSFGWYKDDRNVFIALEYFPLGDLQQYIEAPLPESQVQEISFQLFEGIQFMHANNFAHRDLNPSNVLVRSCTPTEWWVKIGDFGISKRVDAGMTALRTVAFTPGFAAPEIVQVLLLNADPDSQEYTFAVDLWSLGEIVFRSLTACASFPSWTMLATYYRGTTEFPTNVLKDHGVSHHGCDFITSVMRPKPEGRLSAEEALSHPWLKSLQHSSPRSSDELVRSDPTYLDELSHPAYANEDTALGTTTAYLDGTSIDGSVSKKESPATDEATAAQPVTQAARLTFDHAGIDVTRVKEQSRNDDRQQFGHDQSRPETPKARQIDQSQQLYNEKTNSQRIVPQSNSPAEIRPKIDLEARILPQRKREDGMVNTSGLERGHKEPASGTVLQRVDYDHDSQSLEESPKRNNEMTVIYSVDALDPRPYTSTSLPLQQSAPTTIPDDQLEAIRDFDPKSFPVSCNVQNGPSKEDRTPESSKLARSSKPEAVKTGILETSTFPVSHDQDQNMLYTATRPLEMLNPGRDHFDRASGTFYSSPDKLSQKQPKQSSFEDYVLGETIPKESDYILKQAYHRKSEYPVIIRLSKGKFEGRYAREVFIWRQLNHPNIVKFRELITTETDLGFVLESVSYKVSLDECMFREAPAQRVFSQIVAAVSYLHSKGIVHLNICPENIFIDQGGIVRLINFSLAAIFDPSKQPNEQTPDQRFANTGNLSRDSFFQCDGPLIYSAPEFTSSPSIWHHRISEKADVWSCGMVLYFILSGSLPWQDDLYYHESSYEIRPSTPLTFPTDISREVQRLIRRTLKTYPHKRASLIDVSQHSWLKEPRHNTDSRPRESSSVNTGIQHRETDNNRYVRPPSHLQMMIPSAYHQMQYEHLEGQRYAGSALIPAVASNNRHKGHQSQQNPNTVRKAASLFRDVFGRKKNSQGGRR